MGKISIFGASNEGGKIEMRYWLILLIYAISGGLVVFIFLQAFIHGYLEALW
jgi:hypothetical protein